MDWESRFSAQAAHIQPSRLSDIFRSNTDPDVVSFAGGIPAPEHFPLERMREAADTVLAERGADALQYGYTQGVPELRELIAAHMSNGDFQISPDSIMMTTGSQQAIDIIGRAFLDEGDRVLVENPTYIGMLMTWGGYHLNYDAMACSGIGMSEAEMDALLVKRPKLVYVGSDFQNPSGTTFPLEQREILVKLLAKYGVPLVNDNPYVALRYSGEPIPSFLELDARNLGKTGVDGHVIHLGSFSKVMAPGMRLGYIIAPPAAIEKLVNTKRRSDFHSSNLDQFIAYEVAKDGFLEQHIAHLGEVYKERRDAMLNAMDAYFPEGVTWTRPDGGMFILVTLPEHIDALDMLVTAVERGVTFIPGEPFHVQGIGKNVIRLSFSRNTPDRVEVGIQRLAETIKAHMVATV